jgi:nucleotide-binding universal stress UspA family protein
VGKFFSGGRRLKILAATSGSLPARKRADYIVDIAEKLDAELIVLHVVAGQKDYADGEKALDIFKWKKRSKPLKSILRIGELSSTIAKTANVEEVDLIVLGIEGGIDSLNNICRDVAHETEVPILLVPDLQS